jgi:hypothetical protein
MKLADYSQVVTVDQLDAALRAGGFEGVFHYLSGTPGWVRRIETLDVVAGIRSRGWPQFGIDIPLLNAIDGDGAARATIGYGFGPGFRLALDIEPVLFTADPAGWAVAADRWCDLVRSHGLSPGVYGTDETVSACANHADWIWRAKPGECDPAGPGLNPAFFAGQRAIQCGQGTFGTVNMDVSYSQFAITGGIDVLATGPLSDPTIQQQLLDTASRILTLLADGQQATVDPTTGELHPVPASWPNWLPTTLALLQAKVDALSTPTVDVNALAAALVAAPGFTDALSTAVLHRLGAALDKA